jgi:hypothetical protein
MTIIDEDLSIPPLIANPQSYVADPRYADTVEIERDFVVVAQPTSGPNRYTIHVPTEMSVLSLGQQSPRWHTDKGIVGYTNSHIHFETKTNAQTVVSLGGPATKASVKGLGDAAPVSTNGYSMVTLKNAWHDAHGQHYLLSRTADITLRTLGEGKRAAIQADHGTVDLNGASEVNLAGGGVAIGAHTGLHFEDVLYEGHFGGEVPHSIAAKRAAKFTSITNAVVTAHNLVMGAAKMGKKHDEGKLHSRVDAFADVVEWFADLGEYVRTVSEVKELYAHEEAVEGHVKMDAEVDFGISAGGKAILFGTQGASLMSALWTSVSAVVSASLKGTVFAGVAGSFTSLKGYKKIELGCDLGDAHFDASRTVSVSAENSVIAVGKELAQVSGEKDAYFTGGKKAWIGVPAGGGWALQFRKDGVMIGKASAANAMKRAWVLPDRSIKIEKDGFTWKSSSTSMKVLKQRIVAEAASVKLHAKNEDVRVAGKKVLIDGP